MITREIFMEDSYLHEMEANVVEVGELGFVLDKTIIYPGGGGQPTDLAEISVDGGLSGSVTNIVKENKAYYYTIDGDQPRVGDKVTIRIDWAYRYKNMRYHTLLHVISGFLYETYGLHVTSSKIEKDYSRLEVHVADKIEAFHLDALEEDLKELLKRDHPVTLAYMSKQEARHSKGLLKTLYNLIPENLDWIRTIEIENVDIQACGGTHIKNSKEIGDFTILKIQRKGKEKRRIKVTIQ